MSADVQADASPFQILLHYAEMSRERREMRVNHGDYTDGYLAFNVSDDYYLIGMTQVLEVATDVGKKSRPTTGRQQIKNFILLRDVGQGYILKVDHVYGIRSCEIGLLQSQYGWIDGHAHMEEKDWMRINLANLVADTAFVQSIQ